MIRGSAPLFQAGPGPVDVSLPSRLVAGLAVGTITSSLAAALFLCSAISFADLSRREFSRPQLGLRMRKALASLFRICQEVHQCEVKCVSSFSAPLGMAAEVHPALWLRNDYIRNPDPESELSYPGKLSEICPRQAPALS